MHLSSATERTTSGLRPESSGPMLLAAGGMALGLIGLLGLACFGGGAAGYLPPLGGMALSAAALAVRSSPRAARVISRRVIAYLLLAAPVAAAILVTQATVREERYSTYAWWVLLWLTAMAGVLVTAWMSDRPTAPLEVRSPPRRAWLAIRANRVEAAGLVGLVIAAALLRVVALDSLPSPFSGDEAAHALWSLGITDGTIRNPFASGLQGQPNSYYFALAGVSEVFGFTVTGARLLGALLGTAIVPVVYLYLRTGFGRRVAVFGAVYVTGWHFALHFSRLSLNNIAEPLLLGVVALFLLRALRDHRALDYAATGLAAGLALYTGAGGRIALPVIGVVIAIALVAKPRGWRAVARGLPFLVAGALCAGLPLGWWWFEHPDEFNNRLNTVGIYQSGWIEDETARTGKSELDILRDQARLAFGAWGHYPDIGLHYRAAKPIIDRLALPFLILGAAIALRRGTEPRYAIPLVLFVAATVTGGVLTIETPSVQRLLAGMLAPAVFVAVGVDTAVRGLSRLTGLGPRARWAPAAVGGVVIGGIALWNGWYYFAVYPGEDAYSDDNTRRAAAIAEHVRELPGDMPIIVHGEPVLFHNHPTLAYLSFGRAGYSLLGDGTYNPALPSEMPRAVHIFLPHREEDTGEVRAICPGGTMSESRDDDGEVEFYAYTLHVPCDEWLAEHRQATP